MNSGGEATMTVHADPDRLWAMVTDVSRMGEWSPETERVEWLDGASGPAVGARFKGYNRRGRSKWSTVCEVIEVEPGRVFAFATGKAAKPQTVWRYRLTPTEAGVQLTESFELVKPLGFFSRLVTRLTIGVRDRRADLEEGARSTLAASSSPPRPADLHASRKTSLKEAFPLISRRGRTTTLRCRAPWLLVHSTHRIWSAASKQPGSGDLPPDLLPASRPASLLNWKWIPP